MFISSHVSGKCQFDTMTRISMASYVRFMHAPTFLNDPWPNGLNCPTADQKVPGSTPGIVSKFQVLS